MLLSKNENDLFGVMSEVHRAECNSRLAIVSQLRSELNLPNQRLKYLFSDENNGFSSTVKKNPGCNMA